MLSRKNEAGSADIKPTAF